MTINSKNIDTAISATIPICDSGICPTAPLALEIASIGLKIFKIIADIFEEVCSSIIPVFAAI
ncbi:MAG: hypothetical protein LUG61_11810 [Lachnospiraceae bacterium]|nr:hypothetical protein [Lachnospiraceae bacterium]